MRTLALPSSRAALLLVAALAACAAAPPPLLAQPAPVPAAAPVAVVAPVAPLPAVHYTPAALSAHYAATHAAEARRVDSLSRLRFSPRTAAALRHERARLDRQADSLGAWLDTLRLQRGEILAPLPAVYEGQRQAAAAPARSSATPREARQAPAPVRWLAWGALGYATGAIDRDPGGYVDSWRYAPDKALHAASSLSVAYVTRSLPSCLIAGAALELGQKRDGGYASKYDGAWDAGGCLAGYGLRRWIAPHVAPLLGLH